MGALQQLQESFIINYVTRMTLYSHLTYYAHHLLTYTRVRVNVCDDWHLSVDYLTI